MIKIRIDFI